jgi:PPK2 family polyphosphate:nucleotide phosphotransferase
MPIDHKTPVSMAIKPKQTLSLSDCPTHIKAWHDVDTQQAQQTLAELGERLNKLQNVLHSAHQKGLLLVLQGMDTSGKDGTIRRVFSHVSPLGVRAEAFSAPSAFEQSHDYLWRVHAKVPARGEMVIFNRSHYEDVLVTRVRGWIDEAKCEQRYEHIRHFEQMLSDEGIVILKCFLHISKQEQKQRLQARLNDEHKQWKLQASDFDDRQRWDDFVKAYESALSATSTSHAPWHIIAADNKHHRDIQVAQLLVNALEAMKLRYPAPSFDLRSVQLID